MHKINPISDYVNDIQNWSTIAYLDDCTFSLPDGIKSAHSRLGFGPDLGQGGGLGVGFVATDGPNIGGGVPKDDTEYFTIDWNVTWAVT